MTICVKIAIFMRGGNGENTHRYLLRTAGAFSASLYDLCKENKQRAEGGPPAGIGFLYGYTPLRASSGLVVISWYRRVLRGKLFSKGTIFPAQRIRPQPAATLVM